MASVVLRPNQTINRACGNAPGIKSTLGKCQDTPQIQGTACAKSMAAAFVPSLNDIPQKTVGASLSGEALLGANAGRSAIVSDPLAVSGVTARSASALNNRPSTPTA